MCIWQILCIIMEMPSAGGISLWTDRSGTFCLLASIWTSAVALIHCSAALACLSRFFLERNIHVFKQKQQISISAQPLLACAARIRRRMERLEDKAGFVCCGFFCFFFWMNRRSCMRAAPSCLYLLDGKNSHIPAALLTSVATVQVQTQEAGWRCWICVQSLSFIVSVGNWLWTDSTCHVWHPLGAAPLGPPPGWKRLSLERFTESETPACKAARLSRQRKTLILRVFEGTVWGRRSSLVTFLTLRRFIGADWEWKLDSKDGCWHQITSFIQFWILLTKDLLTL